MQDLKDADLFVTMEMINAGFNALHSIATDLGEPARERIDAARMLIEYGGVRHPAWGPQPWDDPESEPDEA